MAKWEKYLDPDYIPEPDKMGNNQRENREFAFATQGLTKKQKEHIHDIIGGQKLSAKELQRLSMEYKREKEEKKSD